MALTEAQLTRMRAQLETLLPQSAVIQAVTRTSDGAGGWLEAWEAVSGGTVAARLDPLGKAERTAALGEAETMTIRYQLTVPHDAPIAQDRRVVIEGNTYEVVQLDADHGWNVSRRAIVGAVR